jgi:chitinase
MSGLFTTYVTTWDSDPIAQVQDMIAKSAIKVGTRIALAFASFNFDSISYIPGLGSMTIAQVQQFTNLVHAHGGNVSLSIGGATYPFAGSDLYARPGDLASNIHQVLEACGFDGVDFDIEDSSASAPVDFATHAASVINTLRSLNAKLFISLTTPAQAWGTGMYQQSLLNLTIGNLNAWQPMEYDLWIDPALTYYGQIVSDIQYYLSNWKVAPEKIVLGLMPGADDAKHTLSLQDALNLTQFAKANGLQGVMTWDANIDSKGIDGNAPYAFCMGIQSALTKQVRSCGCFSRK